jgi:oligosaccharide repeat unit polymerase
MALDFLKVYEIRRMEGFSVPLMGYFVVWLSNVLNCFFIGLAWHKRKFVLLSLIILLQFLLYLMMAHKSYLFSPILLLFLFYFVKVKKFFQLSVAALAGIIFISLILFELNVTVMPASLFIRRTLFVPAKNSFLYYDYFSDHEKMYLSHSKIGFGLYKNPYEDYKLPYTKFMGLIYHDNPNMSMNTGYMGDAYMNFGFGGMLIFSVILALIFTLADSLSQNTNIFVVMGATVIPITNLVNGGLFTNMLTGGFLLSLLIVFLYDKEDGIGG